MPKQNAGTALALASLTLFWAWVSCSSFSPTTWDSPGSTVSVVWQATAVTTSLLSLALFAADPAWAVKGGAQAWLFPAVLLAGFFLTNSPALSTSRAMQVLCAACQGAFASVLFIQLGHALEGTGALARPALSSAMACAIAIDLGVYFEPERAQALTTLAVPLGSWACACAARVRCRSVPEQPGQAGGLSAGQLAAAAKTAAPVVVLALPTSYIRALYGRAASRSRRRTGRRSWPAPCASWP